MRRDKREATYPVCKGCPYSEKCTTIPGENVVIRKNCAEYQRFLSLDDTREIKLSDADLKRLRFGNRDITCRLNEDFLRD